MACLVVLALSFLLCGCAQGGGPTYSKNLSALGSGGYYKVGAPYKIKGKWYRPQKDYTYDETGLASWYGAAFHNKKTANGEVFNKNELTAAHKTLPMPSLARVTNLDNGRSIVVRINDRGPYVSGRIIDLSQRSSQLLGFEKKGVAKVRVQVLADESRAISEAMRTYGVDPSPEMVQKHVVVEAPETVIIEGPEPVVEKVVLEPSPTPKPTIETVKPVAQYVQGPVTGANNIYVQAGAFTKKDNAFRLKSKLSSLGHVIITEATVRGTLFYRVRVGPLGTVVGADRMLDDVVQLGIQNARIVIAD